MVDFLTNDTKEDHRVNIKQDLLAAAVTPLSVLYNDKGEFAGNLFLEDCTVGTVIDTSILLDTPLLVSCRQ